jgi:hypothetical protein
VYLKDCQVDMEACYPHAKDLEIVERLWRESGGLVGQRFEY